MTCEIDERMYVPNFDIYSYHNHKNSGLAFILKAQ